MKTRRPTPIGATVGKVVPAGAEWFHEVKYDGYRLRIEREGDGVRLITRGGHDWTRRFPWIAEAGLRNRRKQFVIDGKAVILGVDGIADFNALHSGRQNDQIQFCAFDVLAVDGEDVRDLPLSMRKSNLERLLRGRPDGIFINPFEIGAIGPDLFRAARDSRAGHAETKWLRIDPDEPVSGLGPLATSGRQKAQVGR